MAETMHRAGLDVQILTDDRPASSAVAALKAIDIDTFAARPDRALTRRIEQHLRRLPGPRSERLSQQLALRSRARGSLVQLEGVIAASHVPWAHTPPVVFSTHNVEADLARQAITRADGGLRASVRLRYHAHRVARCERLTSERAAAVICVSDADAANFSRHCPRVIVAPNGVDPEFFAVGPSALESDVEWVLFFGQFTYSPNREGIARFLTDGWPILAERRPTCRLLIAGEGSQSLPIPPLHSQRIERLGLVDDIATEVARVAITIVPIWSGGGTRLKVLESLAARRPVVGTQLGVSGVGFVNGRHGVVAETASDIARGAAAMLAEPERLRWMGERGRELARGFAWERALAPAERLYASFASTGGLRAA